MPVTAKLSREFYEKFGDTLTNELVAWLNQVDATYRNDLRELNELNFARFDAKLEQRAAQLEVRIDQQRHSSKRSSTNARRNSTRGSSNARHSSRRRSKPGWPGSRAACWRASARPRGASSA